MKSINNNPYFIAEVSSNHNQDLERCLKFVDVAAEIGCNSIKFQLFKIDKLFAPEILSASKNHRDRSNWELPFEFVPHIYQKCKERNISFSCTPFYLEAVDQLMPYVDFYKVASYELLWDELLKKCAKTGKQVIISSGMASLNEIDHAIQVLKANGCNNPQVLHCSSAYPTPVESANLSAIKTIREHTGCDVGWSDHTVSDLVILNSILKWGASIIEFHMDIDGNGYEYESDGHCWLPDQIGNIIKQIQSVNLSDGNGIKEPNKYELADREWRADPEDGLRPFKSIRKVFKND